MLKNIMGIFKKKEVIKKAESVEVVANLSNIKLCITSNDNIYKIDEANKKISGGMIGKEPMKYSEVLLMKQDMPLMVHMADGSIFQTSRIKSQHQ
ncbi:MAG: hypothetical protein K0R54_274 [Clostridiaceae bacterium]|jgi:hypothetical protein|nr:hypothetical protein [Clostridiaceae bacterium]